MSEPEQRDLQGRVEELVRELAQTRGRIDSLIAAFENLSIGIFLYDANDFLVFCNRFARDTYSGVADLLKPGINYRDLVRAFYRRDQHVERDLDEETYVAMRLARHRTPAPVDYEVQLKTGRWYLVSDRRTAEGGVIGFRLDITERKLAERALSESEKRFRTLLETSSDWFWEQGPDFRFTRISGGISRATGVSVEDRLGRTRWELPYRGISAEQMQEHRERCAGHLPFRDFEYAYVRDGDKLVWVAVSGDPQFGPDGAFLGYQGVGRGITEKKNAEERIRHLAEYDALTGLPNRSLLATRFDFALRQIKRSGGALALIFIDLDRFKNINDTLGHQVGDRLLAELAERIRKVLRTTDTVARLGGDEFVVLLPGSADAVHVAHVADSLRRVMSEPFYAEEDGRELNVTPSMGITLWPHDGEDLDTLIKHADLAMYHAKGEGRDQYSFFRKEMNERVSARFAIESGLRRCIEHDELWLEFQPIMALPSKRIVGAETLLRWRSAELGSVSPADFIPVAEESGLIVRIGEWVVHGACAQLRLWREAGLPAFPITVNVAAAQFKSSNLLPTLLRATKANGLSPKDLDLEMTETTLVAEGDRTGSVLQQIGAAGFRLVIDDFGTGYSNLAYLRRFEVAKLKIDQSFVRDLTTDPDDAALIRGIIGLAHNLGIKVVAEGVEHESQLEGLLAAECDEVQGFLLSRPLSPTVFLQSY